MENINIYHDKDGLKYISFKPLDKFGTINSFSTRLGGKSSKPYESLNLAFHTGDKPGNVITNRRLFLGAQGLSLNKIITAKQTHSCNVKIVDNSFQGKGAVNYESALEDTDGLITNSKGNILVAFYADCVPIYFYDQKRNVIALSHAGWKGTVGKIGAITLKKMKENFGTEASDCIVVIGPSIGPCCYEVDKSVAQIFTDTGFNLEKIFKSNRPGHFLLDLWTANKEILLKAGVNRDNIFISSLCTKCNNDTFFSYRAEGGITGRMAALIALK